MEDVQWKGTGFDSEGKEVEQDGIEVESGYPIVESVQVAEVEVDNQGQSTERVANVTPCEVVPVEQLNFEEATYPLYRQSVSKPPLPIPCLNRVHSIEIAIP